MKKFSDIDDISNKRLWWFPWKPFVSQHFYVTAAVEYRIFLRFGKKKTDNFSESCDES